MKRSIRSIALLITLLSFAITGCKKDKTPEPEKPKPTIDKVEIGLGNNETGVVGRDFHFNMDIMAGDKIDVVEVKISPIATETYAGPWSLTKTWVEFKGAKNTNVHKHFDIPTDAVEGKYDFIISVKDENGTELVEKRKIAIIKPENLPVDPEVAQFFISTTSRIVYNNKNTSGDGILNMNETTTFAAGVTKVKGDGKLYVVLINKKHNHRPESIDAIDYSKAIIITANEHSNLSVSGGFTNLVVDQTTTPPAIIYPNFTIGATMDNNKPTPNPITGLKAWESGNYYVGMLYKNTTYNVSLFHYTEVTLKL